MLGLLALISANIPALLTGAGGSGVVLLLNKFISSSNEKRVNKRQDFEAIASNLFKEIANLKSDLAEQKIESNNCEKKYAELQEKFLDFKTKYSELELRYNIQININKKLADEIKALEEQLNKYLENDHK